MKGKPPEADVRTPAANKGPTEPRGIKPWPAARSSSESWLRTTKVRIPGVDNHPEPHMDSAVADNRQTQPS